MSELNFWKFSTNSLQYFVLCKVTEKALRPFKFELKILNGATVWKAEITNETLQELSDKANLPLNEFCFITRRALIGESPDDADDSFIFEIKNGSIYWKKKIGGDKIQYQLGTVGLTKLDGKELSDSIETFLNYSYDQIKILKDRSDSLEQACFFANQDRSGALDRLNEAINAKNQCENTLLSKFVEILNSKKLKIEQLSSSRNEIESDPKIDVKPKGNKRPKESDDEGLDTDEENEIIKSKRISSSLSQNPIPSLDDNDLILHSNISGADQETSEGLFVPKRSSRQKRGGRKKGKQTAEKQNSTTDSNNVEDRRRSLRHSQHSSSSLFEKLS